MGLGGISIWQLAIILAIVLMIFGTKRLGNIGSDLGSAIRGFKNGVNGETPEKDGQDPNPSPSSSQLTESPEISKDKESYV